MYIGSRGPSQDLTVPDAVESMENVHCEMQEQDYVYHYCPTGTCNTQIFRRQLRSHRYPESQLPLSKS